MHHPRIHLHQTRRALRSNIFHEKYKVSDRIGQWKLLYLSPVLHTPNILIVYQIIIYR